MKTLAFLCFLQSALALPEVELIPEERMGARARVVVKQIEWNCSLADWGKPVEVCKRIPRKNDVTLLEALAKEHGMAPQKTWHRIGLGRPGDGTVYFGEPSQIGYAIMNPNRNYYGFYLRSSMSFKRDNDSLPILKGQPSDERAVEICREWMKKLGIEEGKLARDDEDGTSGFDVWFFPQSVHTSRPDAEGNMKPLSFTFATHLIFRQRIGRYPAFFNGFGGTASFELADAGELSSVHWCLHVWEPMGEYEILDRDEITAAIKGGFCWTEGIIDTDAIRIDDIQLEAFHALPEVPQKTFPLIYRLVVHGLHEPRDAPHDIIFLPALKIHRHAYGKATPRGEGPPLPSPLPGQ